MGVGESPSASVRHNKVSQCSMINYSMTVREIASLVVPPELLIW
tara:strand:- start:99 stop:230 length:132 start_codon:yes stop_codon:yes gene_type:complete